MSPVTADGQHGTSKPQTAESAAQSLSLWKIEETALELSEICSDSSLSEEEKEPARRALAEWVQAEITKVDRIRAFLRHCEVMEAAAGEEAKLQFARANAWGKRADALKAACLFALEASGKKSVEGRTGKLSIRPNGGKMALVIDDEKALPSDYTPMTITYPVDKEQVRKDLEDGKKVPGAHLAERGKHLVVT